MREREGERNSRLEALEGKDWGKIGERTREGRERGLGEGEGKH